MAAVAGQFCGSLADNLRPAVGQGRSLETSGPGRSLESGRALGCPFLNLFNNYHLERGEDSVLFIEGITSALSSLITKRRNTERDSLLSDLSDQSLLSFVFFLIKKTQK